MDRVRAGFVLPNPDRQAIDVQLAWYQRNPEYLDRVFGRAALYMHYIVEEIDRRGMPMELALLPVVESAFEPFAYSSARAAGLWQFIPGTGNRFGLPQNWWYDGRRDVVESTRAALDYLQFLHDEFQGDWLLAVAGYNCGENCVARAVKRNQAEGKPTSFWDLRLPRETRAYVPKLLAMKRLVQDPTAVGISFSAIPNEPYFARVEVPSQIDLKLAAELAGLTHDEFFELNPAYHRWATPPDGPHALLLPIDAAPLFQENLARLTPDELLRVNHHIVTEGETLAALAERYKTTVSTIQRLNGLSGNELKTGQDLRVPSGTAELPAKVLRAAARVDGREGRRGRPEIHVVRRGESMWTIARRHKMDVRTLMRLNGKSNRDVIRPGERLLLSARNDEGSAGGADASAVTHRVRSGETLSSIARRYGVTISQITAWNGISAQRILRVGQRLAIRPSGNP
jgi:membrane-bound lytic murein transglycosylase D